MAKEGKRKRSSGRTSKPKRARFKDIQSSDSQQVGETLASGSTATLARNTDSHSLSTGPQPVIIENKHVYSSSDGRRVAQQRNTRSVTVSPAEWVFRRSPLANDSTDSSEPASTVPPDPENGDPVALDTPVDDIELVDEAVLKKRVRTELRAAVRPCTVVMTDCFVLLMNLHC